MAFQIVLNILIAFLWMFLHNQWELGMFLVGYILGLVMIFALRRFLPQQFYLIKGYAVIKLLLLFARELVLSSVRVLSVIVRPRMNIRPGVFALPIELKTNWEITLLACLITLTPGTLALDVSEDNTTLYIHAMDLEDEDRAIAAIKNTFERAILEVTR